MSIEVIQLSNYIRPQVKEVQSKEWVLNGDKNSFYQYIIDRYNGSPTNRAIIDSYSQFIYGKGLMSTQQNSKALQFATIKTILGKNDLRAICQDYALFGEAAIELIYKKGELKQAKHIPKNKVCPQKMDENGDITGYWFSQDFNNTRKYEPLFIESFDFKKKSEGSFIYVISDYQVGKTYFTDPTYLAGLPYAELEEEIANYCINHIKNGLSGGHFLMMNNGEPESDDVKRAIRNDIVDGLTGSSNAGKITLIYSENKDHEPTVVPLEVSEAHKQYEFLSAESGQKIMISHRVTSPILFGIKDNTGMGNNANEMESAFNELMINVITPKKEVILDALMEIFTDAGLVIDLDFIPLRKVAQESTQLSAHVQCNHDHTDDMFADALLELGEQIDLNEWEAIDESEYNADSKVTETALNMSSLQLAYAPSAFAERTSEQDTKLFKIRYEYKGSMTPERAFCRKMMGANLLFRKEDIETASKKGVNKGFGPHGADTYNLFLYKGGVNCKHFWQRSIFLKKNNDRLTSAQARKMLNDLDPSLRKEANFEQNPPEVAKWTYDLPNHGALS
jgi:hypothetical protein